MKIYNPSNAFCICADRNNQIDFLVDPWIFSKAYVDSWLPAVFVRDRERFLELFADLKFVLITHIHEDHLDLDFLSKFCSELLLELRIDLFTELPPEFSILSLFILYFKNL